MASTAPWWRHAVIYQVYVRSFADADGDGIGDLAGVRDRLPYLRGLGVDAIWLTPFYRSPMIDGGYDVADYRDVDPMFGNLADLDALVRDIHDLGLRIIVDLVPNHSSSAHPWFVEALASPPGSPARDRYVFRPGRGAAGELPPNDWRSVFGGSAWTRVADGQWYLHLFDPAQPDFNWANLDVHNEFESILRFWLDRGVDGFRVDVAHGLVKADGLPDRGDAPDSGVKPYSDQEGVHDIYRAWRKILDEYPGDRMAVAEAWLDSPARIARYVRPDELHQAFNFGYLLAPLRAGAMREVIQSSLDASAEVGAPTTWVLGNHDVVRPVTRYGDGPVGLARARAAALLTLALPGSMYIYQGEELGLPEVLDLPEEVLQDPNWERSGHTVRGRDGARVPLPWSGERPPYGFSPDGVATWLPQPSDWGARSVAAQAGDPASTLELYHRALRVRREHPGLREGTLRWLESPSPEVLVFARDPGLVCAVNLGTEPVTLPDYGKPLCASAEIAGRVLPPDTAAWWSH